jgi:NADH-quinone oxidoreductase subunit G
VAIGPEARDIAASLAGGERKAVLLGNAAMQHPQAGALLGLAHFIGQHTGASVGVLGEAANSVGAQLVRAVPGAGGLNAQAMLGGGKLKALLLLNVEPMLDAADPVAVPGALGAADTVIALTSFRSAADAVADVMLPIAPFTETAGSFVNAEGRLQSFHGVVKPLGDTRPGWKVLRVLGNLLGLPGFDFDSAEQVRAEAIGDEGAIATRLDNRAALPAALPPGARAGALQRIADVPIYSTDSLVRRAPALQATADARGPFVGLPKAIWEQLHLSEGAKVRVTQGHGHVFLPARLDASLPANVVRLPAGHADTAPLGAMHGDVSVSRS